MKILQVVRRYGPVGGMERYVWELTRELQKLEHEVEVLCQVCLAEKPQGIKVYELGEIAVRPRWLALLRFGWQVESWLEENPRADFLIHSHERLAIHHATTFHGPPFATVRAKPWWKKISLRIAMQLYLERRELASARAIVPNSSIIRQMLANYYPQFTDKLTAPVEPGVQAGLMREFRAVSAQGGVIGFVGKEWQRKGLPRAVAIVAQLRLTRPDLELWVVGPQPQDIQHLFANWQNGYRLLGWREHAPYTDFDVLLHPAKAEPYGMVISEAMSARVPVVVSDACGAAAQISAASGAVVPLNTEIAHWKNAVENQLARIDAPPQFVRTWREVACEYETIYREIFEVNLK